jgi:hypothetical protein
MDTHISIKSGWSDDDVIELTFEVCDGSSRFVNSAYVDFDWFEDKATASTTIGRQVYGGIYDLKAGQRGAEASRERG